MSQQEYHKWTNCYLPTVRQYELETLLRSTSPSAALLRVMREVFRDCQAKHNELLEAWFWSKWTDLGMFSEEEQAVLKYYYPLRRLLRTDAQKSHCLTTIFGIPIRVQQLGEICRYDDSAIYLREGELVNEQSLFSCPIAKQFIVEVGAVEATLLPDWMPEGKQHAFLRQGLIPLLLPLDGLVEIRILSTSEVAHGFTEDCPVYWEQNFQPL